MQVESEVGSDGESTPIWAAFGDLMAVLLGVFVLILVGVIGVQLHMETRLRDEIHQRELAEQLAHQDQRGRRGMLVGFGHLVGSGGALERVR